LSSGAEVLEERELTGSVEKSSSGAIGARPMSSNARRGLYALGAALVFLIMWALYTRVAWTVSMNSDDATALLQANDFIHGNYLLKGWIAGNISIYTTELPFYVVGLMIVGPARALLRIVPALQLTMIVVLSLSLVWCETKGEARLRGLAITFFLLALPWADAARLLVAAFKHTGTIMMVLAAFLTLTAYDKRPLRWWLLLVFTGLLSCAVLDDELAVYVGVLPLVIVISTEALLAWRSVRIHRLIILPLSLLSIWLERYIVRLISQSGGFVTLRPLAVLVSTADIGRNIYLTIHGLLSVFGADLLDSSHTHHSPLFVAGALARIFGIIVVAIACWHVLARWIKHADGGDLISRVLVVAIAINVGAYLASNLTIDLHTARYLIPTAIFGAVVAGIVAPQFLTAPRYRWLSAAIAAVYVMTFTSGLFMPRANQKEQTVVKWLEQHRLTDGYGDFWAAGILTAESSSTVRIRQVMATDAGYRPRPWMGNQNWYNGPKDDGSFNFLVIDMSNVDNVNEESARRFFGNPRDEYQVAGYKILVWDKRLLLKSN
jgi:hypothetical protein